MDMVEDRVRWTGWKGVEGKGWTGQKVKDGKGLSRLECKEF